MKFTLPAMAFTVLACLYAPINAAEVHKVSSEKSQVSFVGKKADGQHKGGFKKVTGEAQIDRDAPEMNALTLVIDTSSIWSDDEKLTEHLKNPDFFNVRKYPKITFESTKIEKTDDGIKIHGKLTMLEKTVDTIVPVVAEKTDDGIKLKATFKIDRTKWGMTYGEGKVDKEVELLADILVVK